MSAELPDGLLRTLQALSLEEPDAARSRVIVASASRAIARRRQRAERPVVLTVGVYARTAAPFAAATLSAAFIASAVAQAAAVLLHAGAHVFFAP